MTSWAATLDAYEARLVAQRAVLDEGEAGAVTPFVPPSGLGPLPTDLGIRAQQLLAQAVDLEQELSDNVVALAQDLGVVRALNASTAVPQHAHFVDFSA
ncbi:MAG: hypothetical protein JWO68_2830 [Actinomycetia bacterium]|nr:hypothetical protein [Actinomycetes bacterium]